jgi:hexokinase
MSSTTSGPSQLSWSSIGGKAKVIGAAAVAVAAVAAGAYVVFKKRGTGATKEVESSESVQENGASHGALFPTLVQLEEATKEVVEMFEIGLDTLEAVATGVRDEMAAGLRTHSDCSLKMLPSYVDKLTVPATGQVVLALDMGGTNLRVMRVKVNPGGVAETLSVTKHTIPQNFMIGPGNALFDFIAECVVQEFPPEDDLSNVSLGFTFSFPLLQDSINRGKLVEWTKGFRASDVEGRDVADLLNSSFQHAGKKLRVTALVNDTVGTLLTGAFASQNEDTLIGLILGTGSNACYLEKAEAIGKWDGPEIATGHMVINTEWGAYDSPAYTTLPQNKFDIELDETSLNPKKQHYEKMLSGMYLGEIARLVLQDYCAEINLFGGQISTNITTPYRFGTHFMSRIEEDNSAELSGVTAVLKSIGIHHSTLPVRRFVKTVCHLVAKRSARLAAAGVVAIARKINKTSSGLNVAIDGSVFELYPGYQSWMAEAVKELGLNQVTLSLAKDGSGLGAALTAAVMGPSAVSATTAN